MLRKAVVAITAAAGSSKVPLGSREAPGERGGLPNLKLGSSLPCDWTSCLTPLYLAQVRGLRPRCVARTMGIALRATFRGCGPPAGTRRLWWFQALLISALGLYNALFQKTWVPGFIFNESVFVEAAGWYRGNSAFAGFRGFDFGGVEGFFGNQVTMSGSSILECMLPKPGQNVGKKFHLETPSFTINLGAAESVVWVDKCLKTMRQLYIRTSFATCDSQHSSWKNVLLQLREVCVLLECHGNSPSLYCF